MTCPPSVRFFFFFNDTATTEIYTLSLHDALPISAAAVGEAGQHRAHVGIRRRRFAQLAEGGRDDLAGVDRRDRKSTRLNSSHDQISYAVFCLKKKILNSSNSFKTLALPFEPNGR